MAQYTSPGDDEQLMTGTELMVPKNTFFKLCKKCKKITSTSVTSISANIFRFSKIPPPIDPESRAAFKIKFQKIAIFLQNFGFRFFRSYFYFPKKSPKNFRPAARSTQIRGSALPIERRHYAKWSRLTVNSRFLKFQLQPRNIFSTQVGLKVEAKSAFF